MLNLRNPGEMVSIENSLKLENMYVTLEISLVWSNVENNGRKICLLFRKNWCGVKTSDMAKTIFNPGYTGCPKKKNATDLKNSDMSCFKLIIELLFFSKSAIISLNFDIFCRIFGDLVAEVKIYKL